MLGLVLGEPEFGAEAAHVLLAKTLGKSSEGFFCNGEGFLFIGVQQRQQGFRKATQVPECHVGLVFPRVACLSIDRAEDALRMEGVDEGARAVVDRFAGNGRIVGIHHPVDKAE